MLIENSGCLRITNSLPMNKIAMPEIDHSSGQPLKAIALAPWMKIVHRTAMHHAMVMQGMNWDEAHSKCWGGSCAIEGTGHEEEWYAMTEDEQEFVHQVSAALNIAMEHLKSSETHEVL